MRQPNTHRPTASRRAALRAGVAAAASLVAGRWAHPALAQEEETPEGERPFDPGGRIRVEYDETLSFNAHYDNPPMLGRAEAWRLRVVEDPDRYNDTVVRTVNYATVLPIFKAERFPGNRWTPTHNDIWFDVGDGYIHSSWIVPVREVYHDPEDVIGDGFWGEITVPTSWQHWEPKLRSRRYYDMAYGAIFRVIDRADEPGGRAWYRLFDDVLPRAEWWVQASHVRRLSPDEFAPISPNVPPQDKRIDIDLGNQVVHCFEDEKRVFSTRCATGTVFIGSDGTRYPFYTPRGEWHVRYKRPSRRMTGGRDINDEYDLPGVPWCVYFTREGVALHGTYWHNDYGRPRSHGCVNVTPDAAKWIYRWAEPYTGHDVEDHLTTRDERDIATRIVVF